MHKHTWPHRSIVYECKTHCDGMMTRSQKELEVCVYTRHLLLLLPRVQLPVWALCLPEWRAAQHQRQLWFLWLCLPIR
jgi:hypothetical protein